MLTDWVVCVTPLTARLNSRLLLYVCDSDKEVAAFVVAKKAMSNDAATIDTAIILLIDLD